MRVVVRISGASSSHVKESGKSSSASTLVSVIKWRMNVHWCMQNSPVVPRKRAKSTPRNEEGRNREMGKVIIQDFDGIGVCAFKIASKQKPTII